MLFPQILCYLWRKSIDDFSFITSNDLAKSMPDHIQRDACVILKAQVKDTKAGKEK